MSPVGRNMSEPFSLLLYVHSFSVLFYIAKILFIHCSSPKRSMFYFLVRGMGSEQFSLAMGDGFLCLESTVTCDKWQESEKQPARLEI